MNIIELPIKKSLLSASIISTLLLSASPVTVQAETAVSGIERAITALKLRTRAAWRNFLQPLPDHPDNADEVTYSNKINSYTKVYRMISMVMSIKLPTRLCRMH